MPGPIRLPIIGIDLLNRKLHNRDMRKMMERTCENCAKLFITREHYVKKGRGRFCGKSCASSGKFNNAYKHGNSPRSTGQTKEYQTWAGMKSRVKGNSEHEFKYYRSRGIKMSRRWYESFEEFLKDMGPAPTPKHEIDRIDVNGHYTKDNCRWATRTEQMNNTTLNEWLEFRGERLTESQWARKLGFPNSNVIHKRLKRGWSLEKTLTTPLLTDWQVNDWRKS